MLALPGIVSVRPVPTSISEARIMPIESFRSRLGEYPENFAKRLLVGCASVLLEEDPSG
jgi:hypothetical protein